MLLFCMFVGGRYKKNLIFFPFEDKWLEIGRMNDGRPPPCSRFTFTKIDPQRVLFFGGKQDKYKVTYGDVYILNLDTQVYEN